MISIIMPAYNAERYIKESIQSVLHQTYSDWELLILDDGSSDGTRQIAESFCARYPNIHYYQNPQNLGVAETRNRGISLASGEWIAFLDSDDCWLPDKLKLQMELASDSASEPDPILFLFTGSSFMDENSAPLDSYLPAPAKISYRELLKQNVVSCSSVMIRKELIQQYPMKHASEMHEDFAVWLQILRDKQISAYGIDQPLLIYRISSGSKSGNKAKAAVMTFRVYRYLGLGIFSACYYWMWYVVRSLRKYRNLV